MTPPAMTPPAITSALSAYAIGPVAAVQDAAARLMADCLATGIPTCIAPHVQAIDRLAGGGEEATVFGSGKRRPAEWAAFLNAFDLAAARGSDAPEAVVVAAAAACCEMTGASSRAMIEAIRVGLEVEHAVRRSLGSSHAARGWDVAGSAGPVASAAVASRLVGLDADRTEQAIGLATTQVAGILSQSGTPAQPLHAAKAAFVGIEAARLVASGLDGPRRIIEGRRGLHALACDNPEPAAALEGLGLGWSQATAEWETDPGTVPDLDSATPAATVIADLLARRRAV